MMRRLFSLVVFSTLLAGCSPVAQPSSRSTPTLSRPVITPVFETATPVPSATATALPTPTPLPSTTTPFYRLRIEYTTTSPWTRLSLESSEGILTARLVNVQGDPGTADVSSSPKGDLTLQLNRVQQDMWLEQPWSIGMTVDIALDPQSIDRPLQFRLEKGAWLQSMVRIYLYDRGRQLLIKEFRQTEELGRFSVNLSSLQQATPSKREIPARVPQHMLWAFYFPWYRGDVRGWGGWLDPMYTDRPLEHYACENPRSVRRQIALAQQAGIDGFIVEMGGQGPDSPCVANMLDIAAEQGFNVTFYVAAIDYGQVTEPKADPVGFNSVYSVVSYALRTYGDHRAFMRVNGKPLIIFHRSQVISTDTWATLFERLRSEGLDATYWGEGYNIGLFNIFDGTHQFGLDPSANMNTIYSNFGRIAQNYALLDDSVPHKMWAASVMPGFDNTPLVRWFGWPHVLIPRDNSAFYRSAFQAAIESSADWIFITSWNEFQENSHIEPSEAYGDEYLRITREYADRWRAP